MSESFKKNYDILSVRFSLILFIVATFFSFLYALIFEKYNGDFLGSIVYVPPFFLVLNFIFTISPFIIVWWIYLKIKKHAFYEVKIFWMRPFLWFTFLMIIWNIVITLIYDVAVAGMTFYEAPPILKTLIQISIRFNVFIAGFIAILNLPKKSLAEIIFSIALVALSISRASFGIFLFLPLIFMIKYYSEITKYYRKRKFLCWVAILFASLSIESFYDLRSEIRGQEFVQMSYFDTIFGRLSGRLSSFSNSAEVMENAPFFAISMKSLDTYFMQQQLLGGMLSGSLLPDDMPEKMLFRLNNETDENASFMVGVSGVLYLSLFKSPYILFINLFTYLFSILCIFWLGRSIRVRYSLEIVFLMLLYLSCSGVANEFGALIISLIVLNIFFMLLRSFTCKVKLVRTGS